MPFNALVTSFPFYYLFKKTCTNSELTNTHIHYIYEHEHEHTPYLYEHPRETKGSLVRTLAFMPGKKSHLMQPGKLEFCA